MARGKYVHVGDVYVESGMIYIGDPGSIVGATIEGQEGPLEWDEFCALLDDKERTAGGSSTLALEPLGVGQGLVFPAGLGDGIYPVTLRIEEGRVTSMYITFT